MLNAFIDRCCRWINLLIALALAVMVVMVFGNVVLRYAFNSGIAISEEVSRWLFVWITFLGAIVAMREGGHLGMDMVVSRLTGRTRRAALLLGHVLVLVCCGVLLWGLLLQHDINVANIGLVTGMSLSIVYSVAYLCAVSIGAMVLVNIVTLLRGHDLADPTPAAND